LLLAGVTKHDIPTLFNDRAESETLRVFPNSNLVMRVDYFNELDTCGTTHRRKTRRIIFWHHVRQLDDVPGRW
jgi:UDP-glucose 6-dehydrogenase